MSGMKFDLVVHYEDGSHTTITAGQREMAAWEGEPFGCSSAAAMDVKPMMFLRYLAWAALRRTNGPGVGPYAKWESTVDEVEAPDDDSEESTLVPTSADQSGTP